MSRSRDGRHPRGQVLVIVGVAMFAIIAMVGLIIDGGYAWGRQRDTQNAADSTAKAGTVVVQHWLAGEALTDWNVACAVEEAAVANQTPVVSAEYTNHLGDPLAPPVPVGTCAASDPGTPIPTGAQGVKTMAEQTFSPFLMNAVGFSSLTTTANATAVVGTPAGIPGGALPITIPQVMTSCDGLNPSAMYEVRLDDGDGTWEPYEILTDESQATSANLAIVPLCDTGPGSVGFLDYGCGQTFRQSIENPCDTFIYIPDWIQTKTGDMNCCESHMNQYAGDIVGTPEGALFPGTTATDAVVALPVHSNTCASDPDAGASDPATHTHPTPDCAWDGVGNNTWYDVHFWIGFKVDQIYAQGGDKECEEGPGAPQPASYTGKVSCLKGWFVAYIPAPGPISLGPISPGDDVTLSIALIN